MIRKTCPRMDMVRPCTPASASESSKRAIQECISSPRRRRVEKKRKSTCMALSCSSMPNRAAIKLRRYRTPVSRRLIGGKLTATTRVLSSPSAGASGDPARLSISKGILSAILRHSPPSTKDSAGPRLLGGKLVRSSQISTLRSQSTHFIPQFGAHCGGMLRN